jgi:4'-phosphopantetheinyl transferase
MVDIWISDCNRLSTRKSRFFSLLSRDEKARAERYLQPLKKERFVLSRGMLRSVLSKYLDVLPEDIRFAYGEHGKPELEDGRENIQFSLSHSRNAAVLAVTGASRVGIDVEVMDKGPERLDRVIDFLCSPEEKEGYFSLQERERALSAYCLWTANEAYLKGVGSGIRRLESNVTCCLESGGRPRINLKGGSQDHLWLFRNFSPLPDSVATLALETREPGFEVNFRHFD